MESRGAELLLDILDLRWGEDVVDKLRSILDQLPPDSEGFSFIVPAVDHVVKVRALRTIRETTC